MRSVRAGVLRHVSLPILARLMSRRIVSTVPSNHLIQVKGRALQSKTCQMSEHNASQCNRREGSGRGYYR